MFFVFIQFFYQVTAAKNKIDEDLKLARKAANDEYYEAEKLLKATRDLKIETAELEAAKRLKLVNSKRVICFSHEKLNDPKTSRGMYQQIRDICGKMLTAGKSSNGKFIPLGD